MKSALFLGIMGVLFYSPCESKKEISIADDVKETMIVAKARTTPIDFQKEIQPILQKHCNPCHFPGGKMYGRLPFDKAETMLIMDARPGILKRIKEEEEIKLIKEYFLQNKTQ